MTASWMLYSTVVSGLIAVAALAAHHSCRMHRRPVRWVWVAGMVAAVLLSMNGLVRVVVIAEAEPRSLTVWPLPEMASSTLESGPDANLLLVALAAAGRRGSAVAQRVYGAVGGFGDVPLALIWAAATLGLVGVFGLTLWRLKRSRSQWRNHCIGGVPVLVAADVGPALVGLMRPAIVIPQWLLEQSQERQWLVVQHEDEHRRAGDHVILATGCMLVCLMPWNIALWWLLRRTRLAMELDCDARVLRRGATIRSYGEVLLEIAGRKSAHPFGAPALADSPSHLERRLLAMTGKNRAPHHRRGAIAALSALSLVGTACATDLPTAAAIDEMDVASATVQAEKAGLLPLTAEGKPLFVVDGVVTTSEAARRIESGAIRSIEVVKGQAALSAYGERARDGVVDITTHEASEASGEAEPVTSGEALTEVRVIGTREPMVLRGGRFTFEPDGDAARPLIVVDGVVAGESFSLNSLEPDRIERIEVLKGEAARHLYESPRAANGVIRITTKARGR